MDKYLNIIICFLLFGVLSYAQEDKLKIDDNTKSSTSSKVILIIPFDPRLYMSEVDKHFGVECKKDFNEIRSFFRNNLINYISAQLSRNFIPKTLISTSTVKEPVETDEDIIYGLLGYKYEYPTSFTGIREEEKPKSGIKNGQIVTEYESIEGKYFNVIIEDKRIFPYLTNKYGADLLLFISQFEIRNEMTSYINYATNNYSRIMKVHYILFDKNGNHLYGNFVSLNIPATLDNIDKIVKDYFNTIAKTIEENLLQFR